jgi:hypothetical protein
MPEHIIRVDLTRPRYYTIEAETEAEALAIFEAGTYDVETALDLENQIKLAIADKYIPWTGAN